MHRTWILIVLLGLLAGFAVGAPVQAQDLYRDADSLIDGEPTDLEGVLSAFGEATLDDNDIDTTPPTDEAEYDSWFEQLLQILREVGLLPTGTD